MIIFKGAILIFGGPYSNLQAVEAMRAKADQLGIEPHHCICTGDVVAYCAAPGKTVELVRDWGCHVVMGNCEEALATQADDCGCGFAPGSACDMASKQWFDFAGAKLAPDQLDWMASLPRQIPGRLGDLRLLAVHGGVSRINRFLFASEGAQRFEAELARTSADIILAGHCGLPFGRAFARQLWINAGVIGMPANDATPDVWYALLKPLSKRQIRLSFHRLAYDHQAAAQRMRELGLSTGYAATLTTGLWPDLDILPPGEESLTGRPLHLKEISWSKPRQDRTETR